MKKLFPTAHLEPRKGTANQALIYCLKDQPVETTQIIQNCPRETYIGSLHESTDLPTIIMQNTDDRTAGEILCDKSLKTLKRDQRLIQLKEAIDMGKPDVDLADLDFPLYIQYHKGLNHYRMLKSQPRDCEMEVVVIQGPTGTGKSKFCKDSYPGAYWKQRSQWWDNYSGQDTVIIDEFYGWLPFDTMLRLCDRYPLLVETKGGQVNFAASRIVITTNAIPERWYRNVYFDAFVRRVTRWIVMPTWGTAHETTDYAEAHSHMKINQVVGTCFSEQGG